MRWLKTLSVAGKLCFGAGATLLLFVAYQLWGTGLATRADQARLAPVFDQQLQNVQAAPVEEQETIARELLEGTNTGDPVARLQIPKIGVDYIVLEGVDLKTLRSGPGHFPETPLPGQRGNSAIAGHRSTYDAPFNLLNEMVPGDEIVVTTVQGSFRYEVLGSPGGVDDPPNAVYGYRIVEPTAFEILDNKGDDRLTLMGCHPRYGSSQRIVVEARLVGEVAPTVFPLATNTDGGGDVLLGGERGSWAAVAAWSGTAALVLLLASLTAKRFRRWRWPIYIFTVLPFGALLLKVFEAVTAVNGVPY